MPLPNWRYELSPCRERDGLDSYYADSVQSIRAEGGRPTQQMMVPLERRAQVWALPALICVHVAESSCQGWYMGLGGLFVAVVRSPSWYAPFDPKQEAYVVKESGTGTTGTNVLHKEGGVHVFVTSIQDGGGHRAA